MPEDLDRLIEQIRAIGDEYCENQMYWWPEFNPREDDPDAFFKEQGIKFDGELFIRYRVKRTFRPIPAAELGQQEQALGVALPHDYKVLLQQFGPLHLPGRACIALESPKEALRTTRGRWCNEDKPLSVLAISPYWETSDGNSIGFIRNGDAFQPAVYEFNHELVYEGDDPTLWSVRRGDSLAEFLLEYLNQPRKN